MPGAVREHDLEPVIALSQLPRSCEVEHVLARVGLDAPREDDAAAAEEAHAAVRLRAKRQLETDQTAR